MSTKVAPYETNTQLHNQALNLTTSEIETSVMSSSSINHSPSTLSWTYEDFVWPKKRKMFNFLETWISKYGVVGFVERFVPSVDFFKMNCCWPLLSFSEKTNYMNVVSVSPTASSMMIHHAHRNHLIILDISTIMTTTTTNKPLSMSRSSKRKPSRGIKWGKVYSSMGIACFPDKK